MGIFYNRENRSYNPSIYSEEAIFSAFPSHVIPMGNMSYADYQALRNSDVFTAVVTIAKDIARLDIKVKENNIVKEKDRLENLINNRPNDLYNGYSLKFSVMLAALLTGAGYILIERANGQAVNLHHIPTSQIQLKEDRKTGKYYYQINNTNETLEVEYKDVIAIKPFTEDGLNVLNILDSLRDDLDTMTFSKRFFANFFKNGTQAGSVLKMKEGKLSPEARNKIKEEWQKANAGDSRVNGVVVLDDTMDFSKIEVDTNILKLITENKSSPTAVAKAFGLPLSKLGLQDPNTSLQDSLNDYLFNTLSSYMKVITAELNFKLILPRDDGKKEFVFDTTSYRQINYKEYVETLNSQLDKGAITLDEYRAALGMPEVPNGLGKGHRISLNNIDVSLADDFQLREVTTNNQATKSVSDEASEPSEDTEASQGGDISEQEGN